MKKKIILFLIVILAYSCINKNNTEYKKRFPILAGKYFGQEKPGHESKIFAPNIISTGKSELNAVFSPDYSEFY